MLDETYQDRYAERTKKKIAAILKAFDPTGKRCLDIGCNRGELCQALLTYGASAVTGVDLLPVTSGFLVSRPRFRMIEGDVAQVELPPSDVTFCLSVLHHVLGHHGWDTYEATLRKVFQSAPVVFLEIGMPSEKGRFYWKDRILERFQTDTAWRMSIVGHSDVSARWGAVAVLPIHGSFRHVYRIETVTPKGGE